MYNENLGKTTNSNKMNMPTRLRKIIVRHLKEANEQIGSDKIDEMESDIKTFVKSVVHNAKELGLSLDTENYIGDLD